MAKTALEQITARAKIIRKAHPKKAWVECVKAASKQLKSEGKIGAKKAPAKRAKVSGIQSAKVQKMRGGIMRKAAKMRPVTGLAGIRGGGVSATAQINMLEAAIKRNEAALKLAKTVKEKNVIRKAIKVYKANKTNYKKLL